jgi:hypothetical protein
VLRRHGSPHVVSPALLHKRGLAVRNDSPHVVSPFATTVRAVFAAGNDSTRVASSLRHAYHAHTPQRRHDVTNTAPLRHASTPPRRHAATPPRRHAAMVHLWPHARSPKRSARRLPQLKAHIDCRPRDIDVAVFVPA